MADFILEIFYVSCKVGILITFTRQDICQKEKDYL